MLFGLQVHERSGLRNAIRITLPHVLSTRTAIKSGYQTNDDGPGPDERVRQGSVPSEGHTAKLFNKNETMGLNDDV